MTEELHLEPCEIERANEQVDRELRDFQRSTVDRVAERFASGQMRVLVADEVGLGKTYVARGVIARVARQLRGQGLRVVYICSSQTIARQNLAKLSLEGLARTPSYRSNLRLSMQHLELARLRYDTPRQPSAVQLIGLSPSTSFEMTRGEGLVDERALLYALLSRLGSLKRSSRKLSDLLCGSVVIERWQRLLQQYRDELKRLELLSGGAYPMGLLEQLGRDPILRELEACLRGEEGAMPRGELIRRLRLSMARFSVGELRADLVIMDEFQRFRSMLDLSDESEMGMLTRAFFEREETRILLLSATPYKLYETMDEVEERGGEELHERDFRAVREFLLSSAQAREAFDRSWGAYARSLRRAKGLSEEMLALKSSSEELLYSIICRTERVAMAGGIDSLDDSSTRRSLEIHEQDLRGYIDLSRLLRAAGLGERLLVDYAKSCPCPLSFLSGYDIRNRLVKAAREQPHLRSRKALGLPRLWIDKGVIEHYKPLRLHHASLDYLRREAFAHSAERLLWIPPSLPYYPLRGAYAGAQGFSKILAFSSWEMAPRMIATLLSYEAEQRTIGRLVGSQKAGYFKPRTPSPQLRVQLREGRISGGTALTLLYPAHSLAELWRPADSLRLGQSPAQLRSQIKKVLGSHIEQLERLYQRPGARRVDEDWYFLAPMLLDDRTYCLDWLRAQSVLASEGSLTGRGRVARLLDQRLDALYTRTKLLGAMPSDLIDVLCDMTLASPAVCWRRTMGGEIELRKVVRVVEAFVCQLDSPESIAAVLLAQGHRRTRGYWRNLLSYCRDGCLQAVVDEYWHLVGESPEAPQLIEEALSLQTASYKVDTYRSFLTECLSPEVKGRSRMSMRTHFAVCLSSGEEGTRRIDRREQVRLAFNSPLRPFVLASTSVGQEGLDFHLYCRRVMHWNLPRNPIDLEQREGRVNRYKCLSVRQSLPDLFADWRDLRGGEIWSELFDLAQGLRPQDQPSDLFPYWSLGKWQSVKIERLVPMYPLSQDQGRYERIKQIVSLYRMTLGQPRQEELLDALRARMTRQECARLFFDLSPYSRELRPEGLEEEGEQDGCPAAGS